MARGPSLIRGRRREAVPDGRGLEVRVTAALALMEDERAREQSLNTRAIAVGTAGLAIVALAGPLLSTAIEGDRASGASAAVRVEATLVAMLAAGVLALAVARVLVPTIRSGMADSIFEAWLDTEGMQHDEVDARHELVAGLGETVVSRRTVNAAKAKGLRWSYRVLIAELVAVGALALTLATT